MIKSSLEADIAVYVPDASTKERMAAMGPELARFLQVASVTLAPEKGGTMRDYDKSSVSIARTTGKKCVRCWNYFEKLGTDPGHPDLCLRCTDIIRTMK
jgi:isoleucyl-tRNA synthetase